MLMVRLNAKEFILSRSEAAAAEFERRFALLEELVAEALASMEDHDPAHAEPMRRIAASVGDYRTNFEELSVQLLERDEIVSTRLDPTGLAMREKLTAIVESAYADGDQTAAYLAGRLQERLLLGRLYVTKFLNTGRQAHIARALDELGPGMETHVATLDAELQNPERRALFTAFAQRGATTSTPPARFASSSAASRTSSATASTPSVRRSPATPRTSSSASSSSRTCPSRRRSPPGTSVSSRSPSRR